MGHGHTNAERQGVLDEASERTLLLRCRERMREHSGAAPRGWLSPSISESLQTPADLLAETGYAYTLNWCHDDQPMPMHTRSGQRLWAVPYPQELNDIPMIVARQMDAKDFAQMVIDQFDEMLEQSRAQPLVMGLALHPYLVGQPYRLRHLRRALQHVALAREHGAVCGQHARRDLRPRGGGGRGPARGVRVTFPIDDTVSAWVPHGGAS